MNFLGGLANVAARGTAAYMDESDKQQKENERKLIVAQALKRQQERDAKADEMKMLELHGKYGYRPGGTDVSIESTPAPDEVDPLSPAAATPRQLFTAAALNPIQPAGDVAPADEEQAGRQPRPDTEAAPSALMTPTHLRVPHVTVRNTPASFNPEESEAGVLTRMRTTAASQDKAMLEAGRNQRYADGLLTKQDLADMAAEGKQDAVDAYTSTRERGQDLTAASRAASLSARIGIDTPETKRARSNLTGINHEQVNAGQTLKDLKSDQARQLKVAPTAADSADVRRSTVGPLNAARQRADRLRVTADSLNDVILRGAPPASSASPISLTPQASAPRSTGIPPAQAADLEAANAKFKLAIQKGIPQKDALDALSATVAQIAKRYGQAP